MDFDDLDEAAEARLAAGDVDESVLAAMAAAPDPWSGDVDPVPRSARVPGYMQFDDRSARRFGERPGPFRMYLFVFYGAGDYAATWFSFVNAMPGWLDVAVYERPGHGVRKAEDLSCSFAEDAGDAMIAFAAPLRKLSRDGAFQGAPCACLGHSTGAAIMAEFVRRVRLQFGFEPRCMFLWDNPPPTVRTFSDWGQKLMFEEPQRFMDIWEPTMGEQMRQGVDGEWRYALHDQKRNVQFHDGHWEHKFDCDIYTWTTMQGHRYHEMYQKAKNAGTLKQEFDQEQLSSWLSRNKLYEAGASQDYLWDYTYEQFERWTSLTTGSSKCYRVDVEHMAMKFDEKIAQRVASLIQLYIK